MKGVESQLSVTHFDVIQYVVDLVEEKKASLPLTDPAGRQHKQMPPSKESKPALVLALCYSNVITLLKAGGSYFIKL